MPKTLYYCSLRDARRAGMTMIHVYANDESPVPLPRDVRGLKKLVREAHNEADWRGFNRFAPEGMVMVRKMRLVRRKGLKPAAKLIEVSIGAEQRGEEVRIG